MSPESLAVDTDVASHMLRGTVPAALARRLEGALICVTFVTVGELFRGAFHARWGRRRLEQLESFLDRLVRVPADSSVARRWGAVTGESLRAGAPLPHNDSWIAACCLTHELPLATMNVRHFGQVPDLSLVTEAAT